MARPAQAMSDEAEELEREGPDLEDGIDFEPGGHEIQHRKPDPRRYVVPLAGLLLVSVLVAVAWVSFAPRRGAQQDRALLDLPQPASATVERPLGNRSARSPGPEMDPRLGSGAPVSSAQRFDQPRVPDSAVPLPPEVGSAEVPARATRVNAAPAEISTLDGVAIAQRLDRIESSLQTLRAALDTVRVELSARPSPELRRSPANTEKRVDSLHRQLSTRDPEAVRLRREVPANGHSPSDVKALSQRSASRPGLPGWEIVGLSARNVALRDPGGRTHVVAIGETIVDEIELTQIDTVANRITTTAGDITYRGAGSERGTE
jgi:hypothetical protein